MEGFLENSYVNKELHAVVFEPICHKYQLTHTELLVLLFLKTKEVDTAKEIVNRFKIAKSHVSTSIRDLEEKGYIEGNYIGSDRRTIHLNLCERSGEVLKDVENAQEEFKKVLMKGFNEDEMLQLKDYLSRMTNNANAYLKEACK